MYRQRWFIDLNVCAHTLCVFFLPSPESYSQGYKQRADLQQTTITSN
jgi:hypothetical protein